MEKQKDLFNILLVDDKPENLLTLESIIQHEELHILKAASGNEALSVMLEQNVSLVLLDVNMPDMDGYETAVLMRASERTRHIPVIFITASHRMPDQVFKGYEAGAIDYLYKPLDRQILQSKIKAYIDFFKQKHELEITTRQLNLTISELNRAKQIAEEATIAKSSFLAGMSHEIRTPLNGIIGLTDLMLTDNALPDQYFEYLTDIKESSTSLLDIINEILDISKIEAERLEFESIPFSLRDVLAKVVRLLVVKTFQKKIGFYCLHDPAIPDRLVGDPTRIRQILVNLIGNAIKFTEEGSITLEINLLNEQPDRITLKFSVTDTGVGIPADKIGLLFQSYQQADLSTTRKYGGTGLGLTISKRLVEYMGGSIGLDSRVNEGTTFHFILTFPVIRPFETTLQSKAAPPWKDLQALMIGESDPDSHQVAAFLEYEGIKTTSIPMADAWNISHDLHGKPGFHLAVFNRLSLSPDAKNALDVVRKWLIPEFRDNIIVLTSDKTIHALRMLESLGVRRYLHKPVLQSEIQQLLSKVFQQEHSESQVKTAATAQQENTLRLEVLLAEDQLINQKIVVQLLTRKGWTVTTALNGLEAVSQAEKKRFDLILMDVQMPGMDGFEATREIRRNASSLNAASPIIALTANAMKGDRERCIEAGMNDYVTKPLLPEEFFRTIQKYI